jgi:nucleoside-diphosphate kinase
MSRLERTLAIIKPDAIERGQAGEILSIIERNGFRILGMKMLRLSRDAAEGFYGVHRGKPFYPPLIDFMTSGPIVVLALERENAIETWRELMGATEPAEAAEGTIRRRFGTTVRCNCTHGSDAPATACAEIAFFFDDAELL